MQKILPKKELKSFIERLMKKHKVIAPVKESPTKFRELENSEDIKNLSLREITVLSPKQFFIPENEVLLEFKNGKVIDVRKNPEDKEKNRIIFGVRKCDINALLVLDKVMKDPLYISKRKKTIIIGLHCEAPDKYCFCNSMISEEGSEKGYDLFFYLHKDNYYISIGSKKGLSLVSGLQSVKGKDEVIKKIKNFRALNDKGIERSYRNKIWESDADKCLSCSACTVDCPTCNCFDIRDELDANLKTGRRVRSFSSCQLRSFSRVAGGKIFRESRLARFKHFVYHKVVYYKKHFGRYMCTGCGRCLRVCPTKIDWVNTINLLNEIKDADNKGRMKK